MTTAVDQQRLQIYQNFRQFCSDAVFGTMKTDACVKKLYELANQKIENFSILLTVLETLDMEVDFRSGENKETKEKFKELCRKISKSCLPEDVLKVNLDCLADDSLGSRYIKMKTKLFYKQLKFNLLREESEGYAKLLVELNQQISTHFTAQVALERVRCLIGQFNLDPNRVLDMILECFECRLSEHKFFVELLKLYRANAADICHILGFKFTFYQEKFAYAHGRKAAREIYYLSALLIRYGLLDLASICCYLTPKQDVMIEEHKKFVEEATKKQKKLAASSLAVEKEPTAPGETENLDGKKDDISENQKLSLLLALLDIGEWSQAKYLLDRMPEFYAVRFAEVARTVCHLIDHMIDDLYEQICPIFHCIRTSTSRSAAAKNLEENIRDKEDEENSTENFLMSSKSVGNLKEFVQIIFPIASHLGPTIAYDPILFTKLIRLCCAFLEEKEKNPELVPFLASLVEFSEDVLVPALSLLKDNCAASEELWLLVKQFPYTTRYRIYGRWKNEHLKRHPLLITVRGEVTGKTRYIMKRLSKETTKQAGRQIGKLCHNNASVIFDYILNQIQQFENLIGPVVESLKFVTNLSYDVLAYCIIEHLASPEKEKLKISDATLSPWLQSLATFVGSVFKKYSMELTGVLQYVANQLKTGKSYDLCVLREIVENMSGIETTSGLTQEQLEASAGGDLLRQEAGYFGQARNTKRSISRLKDALLQEDLVVSLCILMAQQRGSIVFKEGVGIHLKLVGQMLDQCQETLVQFASFLSTNLKPEDYKEHMPTAVQLMKDYHISPDAAMYLARPVYSYMINSTYDELKRADRLNKSLTLEKKTQHYKTAWNQVLTPLTLEITQLFPASVWQDLNPQLFASFWTLSMYDVNVPIASYERELEKIRKSLQQIDEAREPGEAKRKKDKEAKLADEQRRQTEHVNRVTRRLEGEKDEWFLAKSAKGASITQFLQLCLFPRCVYTDLDAIFCAKFIQIIHSLKTQNFSTLICYDRIFCDIWPLIACMSEYEANRYGRFLCATLEIIMRWHKDKEVFDKECSNYPGFVTRFRNTTGTSEVANHIVDYENYRHVVHKWHFKLTKAFLVSLGSGCYVQVRNALLVLIKILPQYPILKQFADAISKRVVALRDDEKDKRQDLHVLAASYGGHLKLKKNPMMLENDFHNVQPKEPVAQPISTVLSHKKDVVAMDVDGGTSKKESKPNVVPPAAAVAPPIANNAPSAGNVQISKNPSTISTDNSSTNDSTVPTKKSTGKSSEPTKLKTQQTTNLAARNVPASPSSTATNTPLASSKTPTSAAPPTSTSGATTAKMSSTGATTAKSTNGQTLELDGPSVDGGAALSAGKKSAGKSSGDHYKVVKSPQSTKKETPPTAPPTKLRTSGATTANAHDTKQAQNQQETTAKTGQNNGKSSKKVKEEQTKQSSSSKRDSSSETPKSSKRESSSEPKPKRARATAPSPPPPLPPTSSSSSRRTSSKDKKSDSKRSGRK